MRKLRLLSMASICFFSVSLAISANASSSEPYSLDNHSVNFSGELVTRASQQAAATNPVSDEVLLLGAAVVALIGITIMRKTLH